MRLEALATFVLGVGLAVCGCTPDSGSPAATQAPPAEPRLCGDLTTLAVANTTITTAEIVAAGAFQAPAPAFAGFGVDYARLPAFCRVAGSIKPTADSDIRFELWLPEQSWNGRFMQTGNGGAAGSIVHASLADPLTRGYAVANTDTGHQGAGGDFAWAVGHPEKLVDYQYRAVHELTVVGKAITAARYGRAPEKSYWNGCSTGGRQGLKEAQRYPDDYDAIVAGAPASNWSPLMALSISIQRDLGPGGLGVDKVGLLKESAIAACDSLDGVTDRVISSPAQCLFDPASLQCGTATGAQCLAPTEVAAAKRIYAGLVDVTGVTQFPGTGVGSEPAWAAYASPQFSIGTNYFRSVVAGDASWDPATFDLGRDLARLARQDAGAADAMDSDLSAFVARGGKLLLYHGTTDGLIPYGNTLNYYHMVIEKLGLTR
ncbi:MAG TPA: tannase/feruloyl esterase family alpha/beta hydrolase, partial [Gammaproteobacteria bacterium]|nr:tannase/feruloyl esterase family alpha/beta hydrolase [Gammaproteobacteria bacterium]